MYTHANYEADCVSVLICRHIMEAWQLARSLTGNVALHAELVNASIQFHEQVMCMHRCGLPVPAAGYADVSHTPRLLERPVQLPSVCTCVFACQAQQRQSSQADRARRAVVAETETRTRVVGMRSQVPWREPPLMHSSYWGPVDAGQSLVVLSV